MSATPPTIRVHPTVFKTRSTGALAILLWSLPPAAQADALVQPAPYHRAAAPVALAATAFPLHQVRLLEGPLRHAQDLDLQYVLSLDVDRLLHTFRLNAGLPSTVPPLGGWEEPAGELRGHFAGHYLSACALLYASTGDDRVKAKGDALVTGLAECQARIGSGYLSAFPESFFERVERRQPVWAPYYTLHKIFAGLLDMQVLCGNAQALEVCRRFADWAIARNARLTDAQMQRMLDTEHGGMNEALAELYAVTGDARYLALSRRFNHEAVLAPAMRREDRLTGLHANTQIPKFVGTARQYELTGDLPLRTASEFFWDTVVQERSYVIGGHSDGEHFSPKETLSQALGPSTTETCNTYNMLKLTRHLFAWVPRAEYADYYERALYNHILASQHPETGMMCYYVPLRSGSAKGGRSYGYSTPLNAFWCCTGTGIENHAKYGDSIYFHQGDTTLFVNLFVASELRWTMRGITLRQETRYPETPTTRLRFQCAQPTELTLKIRHPAWATEGFAVMLNGSPIGMHSQPATFTTLTRTWKDGDTLDLAFPFTLRTEGFRDNPDRFAFLYGPLVLAAEVDRRRPFPAIVGPRESALAGLQPSPGKPNAFVSQAGIFRIAGESHATPVKFEPFYQIHGERAYVVYWDRFSTEQWQTREEAYRTELARQRELEERTVDAVHPGEQQSETDHSLQGERTSAGDFADRKYRHALDGWFSYRLTVLPGVPQELWVTYWGSDAGRTFDVSVEGTRLLTQQLDRQRPEQFFDEIIPLPPGLVQNRTNVTIRFQAHPGSYAGGVFGLRVMRARMALTPTPAPTRPEQPATNLALVAIPSTSFVSGHETLNAINDGMDPAHADDKRHGAYGNWPRTGTQWVQYDWPEAIKTRAVEVYWFDDQRGVRLPTACRLLYWDGTQFRAVPNATGLGCERDRFNRTIFPEITTTRLRLEFDGREQFSTGLLEWRVYDSGASPNFAPIVEAGVDRVVVRSGRTYLTGAVRDDGKPAGGVRTLWSQESGPGRATFGEAESLETDARFSAAGEYRLRLTADDGARRSGDTLRVRVDPPPPASHLATVPTGRYLLTSGLWRSRARAIIQNWIPHCIRKIEDPQTAEGGLGNFVEAGRKLRGDTNAKHVGAVFTNTWVYNTLESMCVALQLDPGGDGELLAAQEDLRGTLEDWIPKILGAQEPDGYLHTQYTIEGHRRWSNRHDHEGYQAGYFIEAALAHHQATRGQDPRLYLAARRLADCWVANIGPAPKRAWYEGHQALEMALVHLARYVDALEGNDRGRPYVELARFLLDSRKNGEEYDQSHLPVTRQYEAVGHAVRAAYSYAGMTDIALETGDLDYHSAIKSLEHSIVHRKYYVTGGIGSGETSEGFGKDYSLPNRAYCESCAGCGQMFFQQRLLLAYADARHADRLEETLYNAVLGGLDLAGRNFTYTNPLDSSETRYPWHVCPCCVGNLPRTLLRLPTWMYATSEKAIYVNQFIGSQVDVGPIHDTPIRIEQETEYPWDERVRLIVRPAAPTRFALHIRVPRRQTSELYSPTPTVDHLGSLTLNGKNLRRDIVNGYVVVRRRWQAGDTVELTVPLPVQRVKASDLIAATHGRVALRRGPLVYNFESVDQNLDAMLNPETPLVSKWRPDLLGGLQVIEGTFADGKPLLAIPNYARLNRGGRSIVWIKDR